MPATHFNVRWPDGSEDNCYSPSSIVHDYFKPGEALPLTEFVAKAESALATASDRVEQKFGYACSSAMDQLAAIKAKAAQFENTVDQKVAIISVA